MAKKCDLEYRESFIIAHNTLIDIYKISILFTLIPIPFLMPLYVFWKKNLYTKKLKEIDKTENQKT